MIYLVGGSARAGKTTFAERLGKRLGIVGCFGTDNTRDLIGHDVIRPHGADHVDRAERFFPYLHKLVWSTDATHENFIIEGDLFLARHVAQLRGRYPITAVFLGQLNPSIPTMIEHGGKLNWIAGRDPSTYPDILHLVQSRSLLDQAECAEYDVPWFDVSGNFATGQTRALNAVVQAAQRNAGADMALSGG